jgi:beta-lactamase superfamily II metal-dependent hydrolase
MPGCCQGLGREDCWPVAERRERQRKDMLTLRVVQAEYGDCLLLEYGTASSPRFLLLDGGPAVTYERHLRAELQKIAASGGKLDLAILSHVDSDHIGGLVGLMADLREQRAAGVAETIAVDALWHNAFHQTIGRGNEMELRLHAMMAAADARGSMVTAATMAVQGIQQGHQLRLAAASLGIPINPGFPRGLVQVSDAPQSIPLDNLVLRVIGPTRGDLDRLRQSWAEWLDEHNRAVASGDPFTVARVDRSVPNLSSIALLAEAHSRAILFAGDGRGDHLLQGLKQCALLDSRGHLRVDVLKVPHHGSNRNTSRSFFRAVQADRYVISANGRDGHPNLATLIWIVETARRQRREIEILVTNETPSTHQLLAEYPAEKYGYKLTVMGEGVHSMILELAP